MKKIILITLIFLVSFSCQKDGSEIKRDINSLEDLETVPPDGINNSNANLDDITTGFEQLMTIYGFQGAQVAITRGNKIVYLESFGMANVDADIPVDANSLFRIASISKPITLTAISKLVADGLLSLDDLVFGSESILGTTYGSLPYETGEESITIEHLLEHKGGFANIPYDIMFDDIKLTQTNLISTVLDERSLLYEPGSKYEYSNFGYSLLGRIIEKVTGQTYEAYVKEAILKPMEITEMSIGGNTRLQAFENEVSYYANYADPYEVNVRRMDSHGGWISSAKDLARFAMKSDNEASVPDFLDADQKLSYLATDSWNHNGALPGSLSVLQVSYPTSYVVLVNKSASDFPQIIQAIRDFMREKTNGRAEWPENDVVNDL